MRVHELAAELGKGSDEVLKVLAEAGIEATTPASGLSEDEAEQIRAHYAEGGTVSGAASEAADGAGQTGKKPKKKAKKKKALEDYAVLVGKGKIFCGSVLAVKGDAVTQEQYASLPERVQSYFEKQ